ncbi:hypothetical protein ACS5PU_09325 [Pedobacter sp. GSP4]|uniref:hypothetical protein n=1 Tax=Pedobacter sp. GSP4 TaxID=3453716 RepID=UPI003EE9AB68
MAKLRKFSLGAPTLFVNLMAAAAPKHEGYSEQQGYNPPRKTGPSFPKKTIKFNHFHLQFGGAKPIFSQYSFLERNACATNKAGSRVPFYASGFVPQPCRVTLHPGLNGQNIISFLRFAGRTNAVRKPDGSGSPEA